MAKTKPKSTKKGVTIPTELHATLVEFSQAAAEGDAIRAEREASLAAFRHRQENPIELLTNDDIKAVDSRLGDIYASLRSIHELSKDALCSSGIREAERYIIAIREMSRANIKGIDACIERLAINCGPGGFATEFDDE